MVDMIEAFFEHMGHAAVPAAASLQEIEIATLPASTSIR